MLPIQDAFSVFRLTGEVKFILYKGNHYHLTVFTDWPHKGNPHGR